MRKHPDRPIDADPPNPVVKGAAITMAIVMALAAFFLLTGCAGKLQDWQDLYRYEIRSQASKPL